MKFSRDKLVELLKSKKTTKINHLISFRTKNDVKNEYLDCIINIKQGDLSLKKDFTERHKGFISETISHTLGKSTIPKNSPEFDIGLDAFDHSIELFDPGKDKDFLSFSENIIREWVLSYVREINSNYIHNQIDETKYYLYYNYESTKDISQFKMNLWEYGIKLRELPNLSPDEKQNIGTCVRIAKKLSNDSALFQRIAKHKALSSEDFADGIKLDRKIFNKHKKYIIALTLILKSNLRLLSSYLKNVYLRNDFSENIGVILEINNDQAILFTLQGEFLTVKLNKSNKVGEQVKFGSYRVQRKNKNLKYIVAACAVTSIIICFAVYQGFMMFINNNSSLTTYGSEDIPLSNNTQVTKATPAITPEATYANLLASNTATSEPEITATPSAKITPRKTSVTATPVITKAAVIAPTPVATNNIAVPTSSQSKNVSPVTTAANSKANGVPGEVRISASSYKVKLGSKYTVDFYMKSGNNGTMLILYQNDKEHSRYPDTDDTPKPQARKVEFQADTPGTYTYRWELINQFGSTSSKTITVTVHE